MHTRDLFLFGNADRCDSVAETRLAMLGETSPSSGSGSRVDSGYASSTSKAMLSPSSLGHHDPTADEEGDDATFGEAEEEDEAVHDSLFTRADLQELQEVEYLCTGGLGGDLIIRTLPNYI